MNGTHIPVAVKTLKTESGIPNSKVRKTSNESSLNAGLNRAVTVPKWSE